MHTCIAVNSVRLRNSDSITIDILSNFLCPRELLAGLPSLVKGLFCVDTHSVHVHVASVSSRGLKVAVMSVRGLRPAAVMWFGVTDRYKPLHGWLDHEENYYIHGMKKS